MKSNTLKTYFFIISVLLVVLTSCNNTGETLEPGPATTVEPTVVIPTPTSVPTDTPVPVTLTWTRKTAMPTPRCRHAASVVDGKIYLIGGSGDARTKVEMYDPATNTWETKADMPTGRYWLSTSVVDGKIYAIGGIASLDGPVLATVEMYNPATDTWSTRSLMPRPKYALGTVVLDGKIYVLGGITQSADGEYRVTRIVEIYDPETDTWALGKSMLFPKESRAVEIRGKIYVTNGATNEVHDPVEDTWSAIANFPGKVIGKTVAELNGKLFTFGGLNEENLAPSSVVYIYNPVSDLWQQLSDMPNGRWEMAAGQVDGKIYLFGGTEEGYSDGLGYPQPLSSVWEVTVDQER